MIKKLNVFTIVMYVITVIYILFIWYHSTLNAEYSTIESMSILDLLIKLCDFLHINAELTDHIVRKAAHFCEFALLGCLSMWCSYLINKKIIKNLLSVGFVCVFTAVIDEFIQMFSDGRSSEVVDVLIDFSGCVSGVIFFIIVLFIVNIVRKGKRTR